MVVTKEMLPTEPTSIKICVLYDPKDGGIIHMHRVMTYPGGREVNDRELESRTLDLASKMGTNVSLLKVLHVSPEQYDPSKAYKVDLRSRRLIELRGHPEIVSGGGTRKEKVVRPKKPARKTTKK